MWLPKCSPICDRHRLSLLLLVILAPFSGFRPLYSLFLPKLIVFLSTFQCAPDCLPLRCLSGQRRPGGGACTAPQPGRPNCQPATGAGKGASTRCQGRPQVGRHRGRAPTGAHQEIPSRGKMQAGWLSRAIQAALARFLPFAGGKGGLQEEASARASPAGQALAQIALGSHPAMQGHSSHHASGRPRGGGDR